VGRRVPFACALAVALACFVAAAPPAQAFTVHNGAAATVFASGFDFHPGLRIGPFGLAFDAQQRLFVSSRDHLYRFGPAGGEASGNRVSSAPIGVGLTGLAFASDGRLYGARHLDAERGDIVELDPRDGSVLRVVTDDFPCPIAVAVDPVSDDLFVSMIRCADGIVRVTDPESDAPRTSVWATGIEADGLTFSPDGTLYAAHHRDAQGNTLSALAGTATATPGARTGLGNVPNSDGVAVALGNPPPFVVVNRTDGVITKVDLTQPGAAQTDLVRDGSRGDLVAVGSDGCLYATQTDSVLKVTNADGTCKPPAGSGGGGGGGSAGSSSPPPVLGPGLAPTSVPPGPQVRRCAVGRRLRVSVRFRGRRLRVARVYVGRRRARTVRGRALRRPVYVRGLPARPFTVTVRGTTRRGRRVVRRTRYSACGRRVLSRRTSRRG
jgi:hypothetical protein